MKPLMIPTTAAVLLALAAPHALAGPVSASGKAVRMSAFTRASSPSSPFDAFLEAFPPDGPARPLTGKLPDSLEKHLHPDLLRFLREVGTGTFGDGFLTVFDPKEYAELLGGWLMKPEADPARIPFARTAFGDLFYWRDLRDRAAAKGLATSWDAAGDVSLLSVHYRTGSVVSTTPREFFASELLATLQHDERLHHDLYRKLRREGKRLSAGACFTFVPALALGGSRDAKHVEPADCQVHLALLLSLARGGTR